MSQWNEKGVSNDPGFRSFSDSLDSAMGWKGEYKNESSTRAAIHSVYHTGVGVGKQIAGNAEGAQAEYNRAAEQYNRIGNSPPK